MNISTLSLATILLISAAATTAYATQPPAEPLNFSHVIAFSTNQGRLCFFDQSNGKLYIYDAEGKTCLIQSQLKELGKPFEVIQKTTPAPAMERKMRSGAKVMFNNQGEKTVILDGSPTEH